MKSDLVKILEVTRMAKKSADKKRAIGAPGQTLAQILLHGAQCLLRADSDLKHIQNMFDDPKHQIIAMRWYSTVEEMRSNHV
jgi:hypothetical protein